MRLRHGGSLRSIYALEVAALTRSAPKGTVADRDLAKLPPLVQSYLRRVGAVGAPRVRTLRAAWRTRLRLSPNGPWMPGHAEQVSTFDPAARVFFMTTSLHGVPMQALHRYLGGSATMQVRVLSLFDVVDARGPEMDQSETVTHFNDICLLAPAALVDANVVWRDVDARTVRGTFTNAGHTVSANLVFDDAGDLVDFVSEDRFLSADGKHYEKFPWSTRVHPYRRYADVRLASGGVAVWQQPAGDFAYGHFTLETLTYDDATASASPRVHGVRGVPDPLSPNV